MMLSVIQRYKKPIVFFSKLIILSLTIGYILFELRKDSSLSNFTELKHQIIQKGFNLSLILVIALSFLNLFLEALKWKTAVVKLERISIRRALGSVLAGMSIGVFTPNNIGEYGGRILYLQENHRIQGALINFIASISQMIITLLMGFMAFLFYLPLFITADPITSYIITYIVIFLVCLIMYCVLNISRLAVYSQQFKWLRKFKKYSDTFLLFHSKEVMQLLGLSALRYFVFSTQYILLINYVAPDLAISNITMMIFLIFFMQSILPGFAITELGIRGTLAAYFFGHLTDNTMAIMTAAFSIWLINVILPSFVGTYFVIKANFFSARR